MTSKIEYFGKTRQVAFRNVRRGAKFSHLGLNYTKGAEFNGANAIGDDFQICHFGDDAIVAVPCGSLMAQIGEVPRGSVVEHASLGELIVGHTDSEGVHFYRTATKNCTSMQRTNAVTIIGELKEIEPCPF